MLTATQRITRFELEVSSYDPPLRPAFDNAGLFLWEYLNAKDAGDAEVWILGFGLWALWSMPLLRRLRAGFCNELTTDYRLPSPVSCLTSPVSCILSVMAREGIPFILIPLFIAIGFGIFGIWIGVGAFLALTAFMAYFFRDPERTVPTGEGLVVSSADGRVTRVEATDAGTTISVFLSPLDVHINRSPIAGTVTKVDYIEGKKMPATSDKASFENERNTLTIEGQGTAILCTQIAGIVARRIVCRAKVGDNLARGERFGLIKFSSRTDLVIPTDAEICVKVGDRVVGGETIMAKLASKR